jgi:hypothetical protein
MLEYLSVSKQKEETNHTSTPPFHRCHENGVDDVRVDVRLGVDVKFLPRFSSSFTPFIICHFLSHTYHISIPEVCVCKRFTEGYFLKPKYVTLVDC